jgi:uncharacterized membrane protein
MVLSAIGLSLALISLDRRIELDSYRIFGFLYTGGPDGARSILATIAGSMITVAGVTFSITIVALTLAASQFGPRLLRNFMRHPGNQIVLGTFVATFLYCLIVLGSIAPLKEKVFVPTLSVNFAILLVLVSVGILIYFIHHVSTSIQADQVIRSVSTELSAHLHRLFPEKLGYEKDKIEKDTESLKPQEGPYYEEQRIENSQSGYLQAIENSGLLEIAKSNDALLYLEYRPGEFVMIGSTIVTVKCNDQLSEHAVKKIASAFIIGQQRTPEQDAEFAVHQLVEIAVRALSPGINDPITAITCIDWIGSALCYLTSRAFPSPYLYDDQGKLRIITKAVTFTGITNAAFDQIRQNCHSSVAVTIRLLETLQKIASHSRNPEQREAVLRQAKMIVRASRTSVLEENDVIDVKERYQAVREAIGISAD